MKEKFAHFIIVIVLFSLVQSPIFSQSTKDSLNQNRLSLTLSALGIGYGATTYLLNEAWYKDYPRSSFHFFNDWGEWEHMDKVGHVYSAQIQSNYAYNLYRWTGLNEKKSILYGSLTSLLFQSTVEVMDGFSEEWGFSIHDFGANVIGTALFAGQQLNWGEQKIIMKVSGNNRNYELSLLNERADELFGSSLPSRFLKDYNAQTYWVSFNINQLTQNEKLPKWLNMAIGYGAENMYGGFDNSWLVQHQGDVGHLNLQRHGQFYLSPDIDLTKIPTKSKFLKALLGVLNVFKVPLPSLEVNTLGEVHFQFLKF